MSLTDEELDRLADVVELQPTKNRELQDKWGLESGSEVHQYLEGHLKDYYYRDDNSLIRATSEANELVDVEPGVVADDDDGDGTLDAIRVKPLEAKVFAVVAGPDEKSQSVVSVLQSLRSAYDIDPAVDDVRKALQSLKRKGAVEVVYRTVPTFKLAVERDSIDVDVIE
ncbi:DUF5797 family protein [Natronocalculus amylovorans]|uniref:DUF5797 family protein n=1 Tax=Natronocalculus amylovorans TaxID=2917812 RepID=A0AAE3K9C2_9EURY|nr:DUF5797 family protein [Natronocalculus amylovorans]MCL9817420.1 DUF5797 family protein [Natronocalculus amylovorans]NUE02555.1 hypothetical protein [Halorubraceae archaeon YAN]